MDRFKKYVSRNRIEIGGCGGSKPLTLGEGKDKATIKQVGMKWIIRERRGH